MEFKYFIYPALKELEAGATPERRHRLRAMIASNIYSPDLLKKPMEGLDIKDILSGKRQAKPGTTDNDLIIDSFIEKFGRPGQKEPDTPLLPPAEESPQSDYFSAISSQQEKKTEEPENESKWLENVKKLVKNADYEGAIAFIKENYLNNPEKSIYFADQIRFIKKMMLNERKKATKI